MGRTKRRPAEKLPTPPKNRGINPKLTKVFNSAALSLKKGRLEEARMAYSSILRKHPKHVPSLHHLALVEYKSGNSEKAVDLMRKALAIDPKNYEAHADLAAILETLGNVEEGIEACKAAIAIEPGYAAAYANLGMLNLRAKNPVQAVEACQKAIECKTDFAAAYIILADAMLALNRLDQAASACAKAMKFAPDTADPYIAYSKILECQGQPAKADKAAQRAFALNPNLVDEYAIQGDLLRSEGRIDEAVAAYRRALRRKPDDALVLHNLAVSLEELGHYDAALTAYGETVKLKPDFAEAWSNFGGLLQKLQEPEKSIDAFNRAVELKPDFADAYHNLGVSLKSVGRIGEAVHALRKALACDPNLLISRFELITLRRHACDWSGLESEETNCLSALRASQKKVAPFHILAMASDPEEIREHNRLYANQLPVEAGRVIRQHHIVPGKSDRRRIRIGYLSSDYHQHATGALIAELFEKHDRTQFEVYGYCYGHDDGSDMRRRIVDSFDRFVSVKAMSPAAAAHRIHEDRIDILVDLKGYTQDARSEILKHRPAPIQVNFLGYPSTMGADFIDYIIADPHVIPPGHIPFYDEAVVHLPNAYQPNDTHREISGEPQSRASHGLPEDAFVFCSFNNSYKNTLEVFTVWMRLLEEIPDSVLWLYEANTLCKTNLQREAVAHGIDPARLVFARKMPMAEHLARHRLADLFLDTLPYNAHTTASDALWAGLPVLTCERGSFAGRVSASLLRAIDMPELICATLEDYESLALEIAGNPERLRALKNKLQEKRVSSALFDINRYTHDIEAAFLHMAKMKHQGREPESFAVSDLANEGETQIMLTKVESETGRIAYTHCPLCEASQINDVIEADITGHPVYTPQLPKTMKWRACESCGHIFAEGYFTPEMCDAVFSTTQPSQVVGYDLEGQRIVSGHIVERIARYVKTGAWLDIGFGNGSLLFTAQEWGYEPVGLDLRKDNVEAMSKLNIEAHCQPVEQLDETGRFNVVSMADVLEHIPYPKDALAHIHKLMSENAVLFVSMPNMDNIVWRALDAQGANPYWQELEHYHNFSRGRLYSLLNEQGFDVQEYNISERYRCCMEVIATRR